MALICNIFAVKFGTFSNTIFPFYTSRSIEWFLELGGIISFQTRINSAIVCTPELCQNAATETPLNCAGSIIKNGGFCGCSDVCAKVEGETCQRTAIFGMPVSGGKCDDGLECVASAAEHFMLGRGVCQRKVSTRSDRPATSCEQSRASQMFSFVIYNGQWMPKCDADGNYQPKQCDNQHKCFCVEAKTGRLLTERQLGDIDCTGVAGVATSAPKVAARFIEGASQTQCQQMKAVQSISFVVYQGQWMAKCDIYGNFLPEQCDNQGKCFCVDATSGALLTERQLGHMDCSGLGATKPALLLS